MNWQRLVVVLKAPVRYFVRCLAVTGVLLVLPDPWLAKLHLSGVMGEYGVYIGIAFVASVCVLAVEGAQWLVEKVRENRREAKRLRRILEAIENLDEEERAVLREFSVQGRNCISLPITHPTVANLVTKGILEKVGPYSEKSVAGWLRSVRVTQDAGEMLLPMFLGFPEGVVNDKAIEQMRQFRPDFMREVEDHHQVMHRL